jgi:hypothetical protein
MISIFARDTNIVVCRLTSTNTNTEDPDFVSLGDYDIVVLSNSLVYGAAAHTKDVPNIIQDKSHQA